MQDYASLVKLDAMPWDAKLAHVLNVAQPFGKTSGPWFPVDRVPNMEAAALLIVKAGRHATVLCGLDAKSRQGRDPEALAQWKDIWTHPGVYQQVFQDWMGQVYVNRADMQHTSHRAETTWHTRPAADGPSWKIESVNRRGIPNTFLSTKPYQHACHERYGHASHLVPWQKSAIARAVLDTDLALALNHEAKLPEKVVRLLDLGWYLAGFLGSVLIWTHLSLYVTPELRTLSQAHASLTQVNLKLLITAPLKFFQRQDAVLYQQAWKGLVLELKRSQSRLQLPLPDMIRMPQEWCAVMSQRPSRSLDTLRISGLSGRLRRKLLNLPLPNTVVVAEVKTMQLRALQETHIDELINARNAGRIPQRRFQLVERYLIMPEPPHPVPGVFLPWTWLDQRHGREHVIRLASLATVDWSWICLPCLETGLALEEWGRTWTREAMASLSLERLSPTSTAKVKTALQQGQPVPFWDEPMAKRLFLKSIQNLDPEGPMTDGYRFYALDDALLEDSGHQAWPRPTSVLDAESWLRLERMTTTQLLYLSGPEQSSSSSSTQHGVVLCWEDSGLELSPLFVRRPQRDLPLLFCSVNILPDMVGRDPRRSIQRRWQPRILSPWPVFLEIFLADLSLLNMHSLQQAMVIRGLLLNEVVFAHRFWLRNLLAFTAPQESARTDYEITSSQQQLGLSLTARLSLSHFGVSKVSFKDAPGWPATPTQQKQLATVLLPTGTAFRHYPNLNRIKLSQLKLGRIPPGLLAFATNTVRSLPRGQAGQQKPPAFLAAALDHNAIADLDQASLMALAWFVMVHHSSKKALVKLPGELMDTRLALDFRINLWQNPLADLVKQAGGISNYITNRSSAVLARGEMPLILFKWWQAHAQIVNQHLANILVFLPSQEFDLMVHQNFKSLMQHRWI